MYTFEHAPNYSCARALTNSSFKEQSPSLFSPVQEVCKENPSVQGFQRSCCLEKPFYLEAMGKLQGSKEILGESIAYYGDRFIKILYHLELGSKPILSTGNPPAF